MKKLLSYLLLSLFAITLFLGYSLNVSALTTTEYEDITYLNNYTVYYVKADYTSSPLQLQPTNEYQLDQVTGFLVNIDNYSFNAGVTYNIEISMPLNTLTNANRYTVTGDNNMTCSVTQIDNTNPNFPNFTFNCPNTTRNITLNIFNSNGNYIVNTGLFRWNYTFLRKQITTLDLGILENQQSQIIDQNNQIIQGQDNIINNNKENTDDIIENNNQNTQDIIDSNKETQDVIKDQFNDCHYSNNILNFTNLTSTYNGLNVIRENGVVTLSGIATNAGDIDLGTYTLEAGNYYQNINGSDGHNAVSVIRSVENNKLILVGNGVFVLTETTTVRFGIYFNEKFNGTYIYKPMVNKGTTSLTWEPGGQEICSNKLDEQNETSKGIWETLKSIPSLILDGIKGLFVPSQEELQSLIDEFKSTMENKLGAIYQVSDMLIEVFRSIFSPTQRNSCITFPEIKDPMFDKLLIEQTDYCFDSLRTDFNFLFTISDMIISLVCTLAFGNMLYKKYEGFIGGDTSDY